MGAYTSVMWATLLAISAQGLQPPQLPEMASVSTLKSAQPLFTVKFENDSLPGADSDRAYTHGTELRFITGPQRRFDKTLGRLLGSGSSDAGAISVGQTMFTPSNLLTVTPSPQDRPFGAFLWVGLESARHAFDKDGEVRARRSTALRVGTLGRFAMGRELQSGFHVIREGRLVKGWEASQVSLRWPLLPSARWTADHVAVTGRLFGKRMLDITPNLEATVGWPQTYAGIGTTVRVGWGLTGLPHGPIAETFRAEGESPTNTKVEAALRLGARLRFVAYNAFLTAPLTSIEASSSNKRGLNQLVTDVMLGFESRLKAWRLTYSVTWRTSEMKDASPELPTWHRFVAASLSREHWSGASDPLLDSIFAGTRLGLRFGGPIAPLSSAWSVERQLPGRLRRFVLGFETMGAGKECVLDDERTYEDQFQLAKVPWVGIELLDGARHTVMARGGFTPGPVGHSVTKTQRYRDEGTLFEPSPTNDTTRGEAWLLGVRYSFAPIRHFSVVADAALARLRAPNGAAQREIGPQFSAGILVHPWGKDGAHNAAGESSRCSWECVGTIAASASIFVLKSSIKKPNAANPGIKPSGLDRRLRRALLWKGHEKAADFVSDVFQVGSGIGGLLVAGASGSTSDEKMASLRRLTTTAAVAYGTTSLLKHHFARTRPGVEFNNDGADVGKGDKHTSMPSGHASGAFALVMAGLSICEMEGRTRGGTLKRIGLPMAAATALLRISADKHYFTDIVAGAALGSAIGWFVPRIRKDRNSDNTTLTLTPLASRSLVGVGGTVGW